MIYQDALNLIHKEFETRFGSDENNRVIRIYKTFDGVNEFYISIENLGEETLLTDDGITKDIFFEVEEEAWKKLCEKNGFAFNRWHIERKFLSMNDLYEYIRFLDFIADRYCPLG